MLSACGQAPPLTVGQPAPDFILEDQKGKKWSLSELKGKVVFVNFWATWCPPCREEMPSMQRLYDKMPRDEFIMLAILNRDEPASGEKLMKQLGVTIPMPLDPDNRVGSKYGLTGLPESYIVDRNGVLREKFIGPAQWDSPQFVQRIGQYLTR